jgi:hypothetical protein
MREGLCEVVVSLALCGMEFFSLVLIQVVCV